MVRYVFYTYSIKSSITGHLTDRLAIATLSRAPSSTAFLSYNPKLPNYYRVDLTYQF
mgnify:CR=1 FL=1